MITWLICYTVLTRAGFTVKSAGVNLENETYAVCSRNTRILPDIPSLNTSHADSDILILPGGGPGAKTFCNSKTVLQLIRKYRESGKWVAFICAGTTALVASVSDAKDGSVGEKVRVTSHPSVKEEIVDAGWEYGEEGERVVVDGKVVTSRGPGTAMLFALTIVEEMLGREKMEEVKGPMICAERL
ncbi:hypothetical protein LTS18_006436 [Coniosporium uncinatum]|uniref:Uncharacterized protein n=1 Tax=Coniosporium uncinatum TaxID=93489 RepID=A0ACC3DQH2_9PEZI|nr:hypothetical protein LTS18_006436 [Coniosporium uncinatum]